jgi:pimeloyl-ACP methyl ester carboxylesterase
MVRTVLLVVSLFVSPLIGQPIATGTRPQEPEGPLPYRAEDVTVPVPAEDGEGHTLAGTITLPDPERWGDGPYPGVVLISGSGAQNRDSVLLGHKPFLVLSDRLTRAGIAVLRYDDRGFGASTGDFASSTTLDFADDAQAAAAFLRGRPEVDERRVGLIGHSEGGLIAPMVAAREPGVAFIVLLAGPGVRGSEILIYQSELMFRQTRQAPDWIAASSSIRREIFEAIVNDATEDELLPLARKLVDHEMAYLQDEAGRERAARATMAQFASPWLRRFAKIDPLEALAGVAVPVLALNGTKDMQVPADANLGAIERVLTEGPCPSVTAVRLVGLNHLFQPAQTGLIGEYAVISTTFDERTMGLIAGWVRAAVPAE